MYLKYYIIIPVIFFVYFIVTNAVSTDLSKTINKLSPFMDEMDIFISQDEDDLLPMFDDYLSKYIGTTHKLALLLDYDGTLAPIARHPDLAILPVETKSVLERLAKISGVYIAIISGRKVHNVKDMVGIEGLTYAGNHGLEIHHSDGSKFVYKIPIEYKDKVTQLSKSLQDQVCKHGAWVENKDTLLTFHYREVPLDLRPELVSTAQILIEKAGFKADQAHCAVEAKPSVKWNKGQASLYILKTIFGSNWSEHVRTIYVGDDLTDEDAMRALKGKAATFRVAEYHAVKTSAERILPTTDSVLTMLKWVEVHFGKRLSREDSVENLNNILEPSLREIQIEHGMPEKEPQLN